MDYYYFNKQYYFPKCYKKYSLFSSFYQPYTFFGLLAWNLFNNFKFIRSFFIEKSIHQKLPMDNLYKYIKSDSILSFNRGSLGPERKITILGTDINSNDQFFIKYADSDLAITNVCNEANILKKIDNLNFVPILKQFVKNDNYCLLETNILKGSRLISDKLNIKIFNILIKINNQSIKVEKKYTGDLKTCFSHGDFCPWNINIDNDDLKVFDWEMAGYYPLGYDLFTFIFQTSFLINRTNVKQLLINNKIFIEKYFDNYNIKNWKKYLVEYIKIKTKDSINKNAEKLIKKYNILENFYEKI